MKKAFLFGIALLIFGAIFVGCNRVSPPAASSSTGEQGESSASCTENGFEMRLYSDKQVYKSAETIKIWATLAYVGDDDTVTIWHGDPYMRFSITDGGDFNADGVSHTILTSTVLKKGELYRFDYEKSGGWSADDPDAAFWEAFYQEEDLYLPAGEYTITVRGAFSLDENVADSQSGLLCELRIKVEA